MLKHLGTRRDVLALLLVTAVAGIIRVHHLSLPRNFILDELYASDGCLYIGHPPSECRTDAEITPMHPPLAKWMIGAGIWAFGFREAGWRITAAVAGTLTIAALYLLARTVLNSTLAATLASGLLAIDFLHFAFSRTAMLDIFVTFFIVIAFLCLAYYRAYVSSSLRWGALAFGGLAAGAAGASKWSAWPALVAMMVLAAVWELNARRQRDPQITALRAIVEAGPYLILCLVVLPLSVYLASYVGRLNGSLLAVPWAEDSWIRAFLERQQSMVAFHVGLKGHIPYASPAWSWLLLKRPVLLYFRETQPEGLYLTMLSIGSPLAWWSSAVALLYLTYDWFARHLWDKPETIILSGFVATYVPWILLGNTRQQVFNYYLLPAVPFMCLALGAVATRIACRRTGRVVVAAFVGGAVALFLFYRPILVAEPLSYSAWQARMLFRDCDQQPLRPRLVLGDSPPGWCWP